MPPAPETAPVPAEPRRGDPVGCRMRKWDGSRHWSVEATYLGRDVHGHWLGNRRGVRVWRPGAEFRASAEVSVKVVPAAPYVATFMRRPPGSADLTAYVDMTTVPTLALEPEGWRMRAVDLDLDVVAWGDGRAELVDQDEFADHGRRFGYPDDIVAMTQRSGAEVLAGVREGLEPFGTVWEAWLEVADRFLPR